MMSENFCDRQNAIKAMIQQRTEASKPSEEINENAGLPGEIREIDALKPPQSRRPPA